MREAYLDKEGIRKGVIGEGKITERIDSADEKKKKKDFISSSSSFFSFFPLSAQQIFEFLVLENLQNTPGPPLDHVSMYVYWALEEEEEDAGLNSICDRDKLLYRERETERWLLCSIQVTPDL